MLKKLIVFVLLLTFFAACSSTSDKDIYDLAKKKYDEGNYAETLQEYENLLKEFPNTQYRPEVLFEIGKLYHGQIVKTLTKEQNFRKAIEFYSKVYKEFPERKEAPNSLFMIGFLYANEISELDSARHYYNLFVEKYPDNEMVMSANAELQNLGVPAEEILKQKTADSEIGK